jgi:hypothetical protein
MSGKQLFYVAARLLHKSSAIGRVLMLDYAKNLQIGILSKLAMLGSNQRPLPREVKSSGSQRFSDVHKPAQISRFCGERTYVNLTVSACTGVQLVYSRPLHYFIHPSDPWPLPGHPEAM